MRSITRIIAMLLFSAFLSGCSTREASDVFRGSTGQRLLTYSIDDLMSRLPDTDLQGFGTQPVYVRSHFITKSPILEYARQRLAMELSSRFKINLVDSAEKADYELDFFFTSLGTDSDTFGLTVPIFWVATDGDLPSLDILAVRMYHGVSEMYYYSKDKTTGIVTPHPRIIARSRTDRFTTPFFSFPVDDLDENSILD